MTTTEHTPPPRMNRYLKPASWDILRRIRSNWDDDADTTENALCEFRPGGWWIGAKRVNARACWHLRRLGAISADRDFTESVAYYWLNEEGKRLLEDPDYTPIMITVLRKKAAE